MKTNDSGLQNRSETKKGQFLSGTDPLTYLDRYDDLLQATIQSNQNLTLKFVALSAPLGKSFFSTC